MDKKRNQAFILDFDDTLVSSTCYFWRSYVKFMDFLYDEIAKKRLSDQTVEVHSIQLIYDKLEEFETENIKELGLHPKRMVTSFCQVFEYFNFELNIDILEKVNDLARAPYEHEIKLFPKVYETLEELSKIGKIVIFTRGDNTIQESRIYSVGIQKFITFIEATMVKDLESLTKFVNRFPDIFDYDINTMEIWMIGNSLKHDIIPSISLGLNSILIGNELPFGSSDVFVVPKFHEVLDIIKNCKNPKLYKEKSLSTLF